MTSRAFRCGYSAINLRTGSQTGSSIEATLNQNLRGSRIILLEPAADAIKGFVVHALQRLEQGDEAEA